MSKHHWKLIFMFGAFVAFGAWGEYSKRINAALDEQLLASGPPVSPPEVLQVDMADAKLLDSVESTGGKYPTQARTWTALQTKDWMLLNPGKVGAVCPGVLGTVIYRLKLGGQHISDSQIRPEALDLAVGAFEGRTAAFTAYVPRFAARPEGLELCLGFRYDEHTGRLMAGTRAVALMTNEQPGLSPGAQ